MISDSDSNIFIVNNISNATLLTVDYIFSVSSISDVMFLIVNCVYAATLAPLSILCF